MHHQVGIGLANGSVDGLRILEVDALESMLDSIGLTQLGQNFLN